MKRSKTPKMPKDMNMPTSIGGQGLFQMPYKRNISKKLGTSELPVGPPVPDRMLPPMKPKGALHNFKGTF